MSAHTGQLTGLHVAPGRVRRMLHHAATGTAPVAARALRPPLERGERVFLDERDLAGAPIVATSYALYHRVAGPLPDEWHRLPWEELGRVRWDPRAGVLQLTRFTGDGMPARRLRLTAATRLPALVRERVAATEVIGTRFVLDDGRAAAVAVRRRPSTGALVWVVLLPDGVDPSDSAVRGQIDGAIYDLRLQLAA